MKKRLLSLFLALVMTCSLLPAEILAAETNLSWSGGTITLASGTAVGSYTLTTLAIYRQGAISNYPEITNVTQNGNTINIILEEDTDLSYPLQMGFSGNSGYVQNANNTCTLNKGKGTATVAVQAKPAPAPNAPVLGTGTFTVNFTVEAGETYEVTAPIGEGFTFDGDEVARKGRDYTFKITANEGYDASGVIVKVNGDIVNGTDGTYKVESVSKDLVITVEGITKKEVCNITAPAGEGFTFTGAETVYVGEDYTFTITVDDAYTSANMTVKANGDEVSGNNGSYTIASVDEDTTITVEGIVQKTVYTVTLTEGNGYTITGQSTSYAGEPYTFTVAVAQEYFSDAMIVKVNDEEVSLTEGSYTIPSLNGNTSVTVEGLRAKAVYNVSKNTVEGATINGNDTVLEKDTYTFTITVGDKYDATNMVVKVNDSVVTADNGTYKVENVLENLEITVEGLVIDTSIEPTKILTGGRKPNSSWGYVDTITVDNVAVEEYKWQGDTAYVVLTEDTADDAEVKVSFKTGGMRMGAMPETVIKLENGEAEKAFTAKTTAFNYTWNFKIVFTNKGFAPTLADGISESIIDTAYVRSEYTLDVSELFTSILGKELTYFVKEDEGEYTQIENSIYKFTPSEIGTKTLVFKANDGKLDSDKTYTVNLSIVEMTYLDMTFVVPAEIELDFYGTEGFGADGIDICGDKLEFENNEGTYTVTVPANYTEISFRDNEGRGVSVTAAENAEIVLREVETSLVNIADAGVEGTVKVSYNGHTAAGSDNKYLLAVGTEYTYTGTPKSASYLSASKTETLEAGENAQSVVITVQLNKPLSITVPDGAKAQLYKYNKYYDNTELNAEIISENDNDTTTYQFVADTKASGAFYIYRVSMEGKITKAGWVKWGQQEITVTYTENDKEPSYRLDDYSQTGTNNSGFTEDSVLLNVNRQNHLSMNVGDKKTLKAYRAWEIIPVSYNNYILTPDFHFNILSGEDVISLTEKASPSTADGDWMTVTALKQGTAIIEVTYDAIEVKGGDYDGVYGASDPNRTGLVVVTVGGETPDVIFGIKGKASQGSVVYENSTPKAWDAEFDTLYFTGESGEIKLTPTVTDDTITEVAVSNDMGANWTVLTSNESEYTAKIASGNNIIRVTTEKGVAYQIVRGDKVTVRMYNMTNDGQPFAAGDTVRVHIDGLHTPIPKMAGNYNPGYGGNTDGYSSQHMSFTFNGSRVDGAGAQYNFITAANYVDIVIPENTEETSFNLTDGYIGVGIIGLTQFADGGDSHRNIPDSGCSTRGSSTTFNTRSMLPDITVEIGGIPTGNTAPYVREKAPETASVTLGKTYAVNLPVVFEDRENDELTYKVSIDGAEAVETEGYFTYTPEAEGEYELTFTASDGEFEVSHVIILTVNPALPQNPAGGPDFGLSADEIDGYVYISFTDKGERVEGESGVTYPEPLGTIIGRTKVPYTEGDTIADATLRLLYAKDMTASYSGSTKSGFYLGAIGNFTVDGIDYDSFGEFDAGVGSGWMITHNDVFIEYGASEFEVADGDVIKWKYTCQYGADIGDPYFDSMGGASALPGTGSGTTEIVPEVKVESDGSAKAEVSDKELKDAIAQSKSEEAPVITIAPEGGENAESLTVSIPTDTLAKVYDQTNASVNIETAQASVVIPNEVIKNITENAEGSTVSIIIEQKKPEDTKADVLTDKQAENAVIVEVKIVSRDENISEFAEDIHIEIPVKSDKHDKNKDYRVYIIHDDGSKEWTRGTSISDGDKHHVRIRTRKLSTFILTDIVMEKLADIENHWGIDAINFVYDKNIMTGTSGTTFEPDTVLSRGMLATVLYRLAGSPEITAENPFSDVKADEWYTDAVIWAYENKIVQGFDGKFDPNGDITREQFALMLMNYAKFKGIDTSAKNDLSQFVDADDTSLWALEAMQWAVAEGYITGRDTGLAPGMTANRAETATILMRFIENK